MTRQKPRLVRFVSPFGTPAWMPPDRARKLLEEDDRRWCRWSALGLLTESQRAIGPPHIERGQ